MKTRLFTLTLALATLAAALGSVGLVGPSLPAASAASSSDCLRLVETVPVPAMPNGILSRYPPGEGPTTVAYNPLTDKLYSGGAGGSIEDPGVLVVSDRSTAQTLAVLDLPGVPFGSLAVDTVANQVYAGSRSDGTVTVVDGASDQVVATVAIPETGLVFDIEVDEANQLAYVSSISRESGSWVDTISVIDAATNTIVRSWNSQSSGYRQIESITLDQTADRLYAAADFGGQVLVFEASSLTPLNPISTGGESQDVVVDASAGRLYVANYFGGTRILVLDASTGASVATISLGGFTWGGMLALDAPGQTLYAANNVEGGSSRIAVIDTATNAVREFAPMGGTYLRFVAESGELPQVSGRRGSIDVYEERPCTLADTQEPVLAIQAPLDGATIPIYSRIPASWSCADAESGLKRVSDPNFGADFCFGGELSVPSTTQTGAWINTLTPGA